MVVTQTGQSQRHVTEPAGWPMNCSVSRPVIDLRMATHQEAGTPLGSRTSVPAMPLSTGRCVHPMIAAGSAAQPLPCGFSVVRRGQLVVCRCQYWEYGVTGRGVPCGASVGMPQARRR